MGKLIEVKSYVNSSTGEIAGRSQKELPEYFKPESGYRLMARTKNVRTFPEIPFPAELSRMELGHLCFLSRSIWANTGALGDTKRRSFKPFSDEALLKHVGFTDERYAQKWLKKMVRLSLLRSVDVNLPDGSQERQWYINPLYFCPMHLTRQAYLIWRDQVEMLCPEYVRQLFDE